MNQNKVGELIEHYRKEKGMTQQELADLLGVSNTAISKWENGNNLPDISMLEPLSNVLDIDMLELITAQNTTHEESSKKHVKQKKEKLHKRIMKIAILIAIICITNTITYYIGESKLNTYREESIEVYKLTTNSKDIIFEGYIVFDNKTNLIFIDKILLQNPSSINPSKVETIKLTIESEDNVLISKNIDITNQENTEYYELLNKLRKEHYVSTINIKELKDKLDDFSLTLKFIYKNGESTSIKSEIIYKSHFISENNN